MGASFCSTYGACQRRYTGALSMIADRRLKAAAPRDVLLGRAPIRAGPWHRVEAVGEERGQFVTAARPVVDGVPEVLLGPGDVERRIGDGYGSASKLLHHVVQALHLRRP